MDVGMDPVMRQVLAVVEQLDLPCDGQPWVRVLAVRHGLQG